METTRSKHEEGRPWRLQDARARTACAIPKQALALVRAMADARVRDLGMEHPKITPSVRDVQL